MSFEFYIFTSDKRIFKNKVQTFFLNDDFLVCNEKNCVMIMARANILSKVMKLVFCMLKKPK